MTVEPIIPLYKPVGLTPRQAIEQLADELKLPKSAALGYAGRLDPMADGLLLAMIDSGNSKQAPLTGLDKRYRFKLLLGISTDSFDLLGLPQLDQAGIKKPLSVVKKALSGYVGTFEQTYPPYSAVQVKGKPLFWWARHNKLSEITIPTKERTISELKLVASDSLPSDDLMEAIEDKIWPIAGDFRQADILIAWHDLLDNLDKNWQVITVDMHCSSGTYVRRLVDDLGKTLGTRATTLSITRTGIGDYSLDDCHRLKDCD